MNFARASLGKGRGDCMGSSDFMLTRPSSLNEWFERADEKLFPLLAESAARALAYVPSSTDVFISPFMKCGTTWLQQIVHTLRTGGDLEFDDISRVIPWFENAHAQGIDIYAKQPGYFQVFKSHLSIRTLPKGARYLISIRNPKDALISMYQFFDGWQFASGSVSIEEFADAFYTRCKLPESYWDHLSECWLHRDDDNVLLLSYEYMSKNPASTIEKIAEFIGVPLNADLLRLTLEYSSIDFMRANNEKFDEKITNELNEKIGFIPFGGDSYKVKSGKIGSYKNLISDELENELDEIWAERIGVRFGIYTYEDMVSILGQ